MTANGLPEESFRPTADIAALRQRARLTSVVRRFFEAEGYWEVETPLISRDVVVDAHLDPFVVHAVETNVGTGAAKGYLQTSPEFAMKRLLAAGADRIFQITHAFRDGELGERHNPEFMMLEWYAVETTHLEQMDLTERLVREFFAAANKLSNGRRSSLAEQSQRPFERLTYNAAFRRELGTGVLGLPVAELKSLAEEARIAMPATLEATEGFHDEWLNVLLASVVEPRLGRDRPTFLYNYPASQAALARLGTEEGHNVAQRFELYCDGIELCNGYHELRDADELRERQKTENQRRRSLGKSELPETNRLLDAMQAGLPACSGVALGLDRLMMLGLGKSSIDEVIGFPFDRA